MHVSVCVRWPIPPRRADVGEQREGLVAAASRGHSTLRAAVRQSLVIGGGDGGRDGYSDGACADGENALFAFGVHCQMASNTSICSPSSALPTSNLVSYLAQSQGEIRGGLPRLLKREMRHLHHDAGTSDPIGSCGRH